MSASPSASGGSDFTSSLSSSASSAAFAFFGAAFITARKPSNSTVAVEAVKR